METIWQSSAFPELPGSGVAEGTVAVGRINMNVCVGVSVSVGVEEGSDVLVMVGVGEATKAVCDAAALAVSTIIVPIEFGSNVGTGAEIGAQDRMKRTTMVPHKIRSVLKDISIPLNATQPRSPSYSAPGYFTCIAT